MWQVSVLTKRYMPILCIAMATQSCTTGGFTRINEEAATTLDRLSRRFRMSRARLAAVAIDHFDGLSDDAKVRAIASASGEPAPRKTRRSKS